MKICKNFMNIFVVAVSLLPRYTNGDLFHRSNLLLLNRLKSTPRASWLVLIVLVAIPLLFFWRISFSGMVMARGDVYNYFYPLWDVRSASLRVGQVPLWSPDVFMGVPLLANSQLGTFYPPNWLVTPFTAPTAITLSLLAHTMWALLGVYLLTRRVLRLDPVPALVAGVLFGLGGYLGGQSEHINQLQALSWMPWLFLVVSHQLSAVSNRSRLVYGILVFGVCVALQLLAGHPQTVFITLVGLGVFGFVRAVMYSSQGRFSLDGRALISLIVLLGVGGVLGLALAAPQLVPTIELMRLGNRGGGLDPQKVLAFSFTPLLMGRGLLPSYDGLLFGEYIAYSGVIGLSLAILGVFSRQSLVASQQSVDQPDGSRNIWPFLALVVVGFVLALGAYNPLNWLIAGLPGFSFFRVPARWMALEALGVAALAGVGLQSLLAARPRKQVILVVIVVIAGLALASMLAGRQPVDVIGPAVPTLRSWVGWGVALAVLLVLLVARRWLGGARVLLLVAAAAVIELFAASQIMPFNLTAPEDVYSASRFTMRQLQVYGEGQTPAGRLLSISPLEFDPGDKDALNARYAALGMDALATRIALVATKLREVIGPNLGLRWGIPTIDGFDGGLLPTRYYSAFSLLLLPTGSDPSSDGRLREMLALPQCNGACIPEQRWLNLTNTRYLITDKTADVVEAGIFYDTSVELSTNNGELITLEGFLPFETDAIGLRCRHEGACAADVTITYTDGTSENITGSTDFAVLTLNLNSARTPVRISIKLVGETQSVRRLSAITLIDTRTWTFQQLALPPFKRLLSSDIKLYENTSVQPRAFTVHNAVVVDEDAGTALTLMRDPAFDPTQTVTVVGGEALTAPDEVTSSATIVSYTPERVEVQVTSSAPAYLVLTDAYYPGWVATVNGETAPILRADLMFRAVAVEAGSSTVVFEYRPWWWPVVPLVGAGLWLVVGGVWVLRRRG
ncbi:MAG: YfhO family protein [Anaerolineae bacterium]|nr:YfhO family protein [Anaerolineae bacterium]